MYVSECAYMLGVSEALIINEINKQVSQTKQKGKKDNNVENPEDLPNQSASNRGSNSCIFKPTRRKTHQLKRHF